MTTFFSLLAELAGLVETEGQRDRPMKVTVVVCGLSAPPDTPEFERGPNASLADSFRDYDNLRLRFVVNQKACPHLPWLSPQGQHERRERQLGCESWLGYFLTG